MASINIKSKSFAKKIQKVLNHFKTSENLSSSLEVYNITRFDFDEYMSINPIDRELYERINKSVSKSIIDKTQKKAFSKNAKVGSNVQLEILRSLDKERFRMDKIADELSNDLSIEELQEMLADLREQTKNI